MPEHYLCGSNAVPVTDTTAVEAVINDYENALRTPYDLSDGLLQFTNDHDTFDVYDSETGSQIEEEFLEALQPYLDDTLVIRNVLWDGNVPTITQWVVDDQGVHYETFDSPL